MLEMLILALITIVIVTLELKKKSDSLESFSM